jgi:hypothetical protein
MAASAHTYDVRGGGAVGYQAGNGPAGAHLDSACAPALL